MTDQELIYAVVDSYEKTASFKKTASALHISTAKVRKALLTAGVWTNDTAEEIQKIRDENESWTDKQIAEHLHISINAVQMYTPYKLGPYTGDGSSAGRMAEYRERNREKKDNPDLNRKEVAQTMTEIEKKEDPFDRQLDDLSWYEEENRKAEEAGLPFPTFRYNPNAIPHVDDQFFLDYRLVEPAHERGRSSMLAAFRLRLSVDTDEMSPTELEKIHSEYDVKRGWTRELIVPSAIPLHFLHYIIQRAFGFENTGDHLFQLTDDDFENALDAAGGEELRSYCRLCGILFRFPQGNDEELYWDDDYDGKKSIRTWMKEKYTGKWDTYAGTGYSYADNQYRIWRWLGDRVVDFHTYAAAFDADDYYEALEQLGAPESYTIGELDEDAIPESCQFPFNNILESLTLEDLLTMEDEEPYFEDDLEVAESELLDNLVTLEKAREAMDEAQAIYKILERRMKAGQWEEDALLVKRWREAAEKAAELFVLARGGAEVQPFTRDLLYLYDFGRKKSLPMEGEPKWKIKIHLEEAYYDNSIYFIRNYTAADATGAPFRNDPEHEAEMADRLHAMCYWKEKLEVTESFDRWIRPEKESDMMIELREEQQLLPEERERIEQDRRPDKEREVIEDDALYQGIRKVILNRCPVCMGKEGTEPGEGYPEKKIRNTSVEKLV